MRGIAWIRDEVWQNLCSKRMLIFCLFQFTILHGYLQAVRVFCNTMEIPISQHVMTLLGGAIYVVVIYGISVVYFYSYVPCMQKSQLYAMVRLGKRRWMVGKILQICLSALALVVVEFLLILGILFPYLRWEWNWGDAIYQLTEVEMAMEFQIMFPFSYELIQGMTAMEAGIWYVGLMWLATSVTGMCMLVVSLYFGRTSGILVGALLAFLHIAFENMLPMSPWMSYISPFSWMNLSMHYLDFWYEGSISQSTIPILGLGLLVVFGLLAMVAIEKKEIVWLEEN